MFSTVGRRYALVALVGLIAVLPVWIPTFPAMCDAPQHASQAAIYAQLGQPGFAFSQLFVSRILTPNLAGYSFLLALSPLVGIVAACKLTISVALLGFLLATCWLLSEFGGDPRLALLAIPGLFGYTFQWGFIGFLLSLPVGICFLILALRYFRRPTVSTGVGLALALLVVFFCHALAAGCIAGLAAVYALADLRSVRQLLLRWLPILATLAAAGLWWVHSVAHKPLTHAPMEWDIDWARVPDLFVNVTGWPDALIASLFVLILVVPVAALLGMRRSLRHYLLFGFCMAAAIFAPQSIFGVASIYQRFTPFVLPCFALALRPGVPTAPRRANLAVAWLVACALFWSGGLAWRMSVFERETRGFAAILPQMLPGQRVLSINYERNSRVFDGAVMLHHPVWYSALKHGVVDPSFATGNVDLVLYQPDFMPTVRMADFEFHPERFNWQQHQGGLYRYFVVHSPAAMGLQLFAAAGAPVILRAHADDWWLYENTAFKDTNQNLAQENLGGAGQNRTAE